MKKRYLEVIDNLKNQKAIILSSISQDGYPSNRAMLTIKRKFNRKEMYFSTNTSSSKIEEYLKNNKASIYYYDDTTFEGIMLQGHIEVKQDSETKDFFWHKGDEQYYPLGKTDPDYTILKFNAVSGSHYKNGITTKFVL